jgi:hypothetical protein
VRRMLHLYHKSFLLNSGDVACYVSTPCFSHDPTVSVARAFTQSR